MSPFFPFGSGFNAGRRGGFIEIPVLFVLFAAISAVLLNTPIRAEDNLDFATDGGTMDAGTVENLDSPKTWTVTLPDNFTKVETVHYDKNSPSNMRKYMGWQGELKVNGTTIWEFKNWSSATGGIVYDAVLGQEVRESTGFGQWIDATQFFRAGANAVVFAHNTGGGSIGLKIRVTTGTVAPPPVEVKEPDGAVCASGSECEGGYCVHGVCRSAATYCGDGHCDTNAGELYAMCQADCPKPPERVVIYKVGNIVTVDEFGGAVENLEIRFPPEEWNEVGLRGKAPTKEVLDQFSGQLLRAAKGLGLDVLKANATVNARQRLLVFSVIYRSFAFPADHFGLEDSDRQAISTVGSVLDLNACRPEDFVVSIKKNDVTARATCEQTLVGVEKITRSRFAVQRTIRLPAQASEIAYDRASSMLTYRLMKASNGSACTTKSDCASGNCRNGRCCMYGQNCCWPAKTKCPAGQYCSGERFACVPALENGNTCTTNNQCKSGNCGKGICCAKGKTCCKEDANCSANSFCEAWETYSCVSQKDNGKKCGQPRECKSGYCDAGKCAAAPKPVSIEPAAPGSVDGISLIAPTSLFLSKAESRSPAIRIQNGGQEEVLLLENVQVRNSSPDVVGVNQNALRIVKGQGMVPGLMTSEIVGTESEDLLSSIDTLKLIGKKQGQSEIELRAGYAIGGQTKWLTTKIKVVVSGTNIRQEPIASTAFGEDMLFREKRSVRDPASGKTKEVVFVEPEDDASYQASLGAWKLAETTFSNHLANLWDDFKGSVEPGVMAFFSSAQKLAQAKTPDEITEQTLRAVAPEVITGAFDFLQMGAAVQRLEREERAFLNRFKANEFTRIPIVDAKGKVTGYAKAVAKEHGGKWYAVRIGEY